MHKRSLAIMRAGAANQLYSHVNLFAVAARLGAEVVLPPVVHRSSFEHAYDSAEANWTLAPTSSILDVDQIIAFWRARGITVHRVTDAIQHPSFNAHDVHP